MKLRYEKKYGRSAMTYYTLRAALFAAIAFNVYGVFYVFCVEENDPMIYEGTASVVVSRNQTQNPDGQVSDEIVPNSMIGVHNYADVAPSPWKQRTNVHHTENAK